jgi:hypothetical protein
MSHSQLLLQLKSTDFLSLDLKYFRLKGSYLIKGQTSANWDETWAMFSTLEVGVCMLCKHAAIKQKCQT